MASFSLKKSIDSSTLVSSSIETEPALFEDEKNENNQLAEKIEQMKKQAFQKLAFEPTLEQKQLPKGNFGKVTFGYHTKQDSQRKVALKVIEWKQRKSIERFTSDVKQEINTMANMGKHVNIIEYINSSFEILTNTGNGDTVFACGFIMIEALEISVGDYIKKNGTKFNFAQFRALASGVGSALVYLHDRRITHLDIKPDNIMIKSLAGINDINPDPSLFKLIDFGLSSKHTMMRWWCWGNKRFGGTRNYMSPELRANVLYKARLTSSSASASLLEANPVAHFLVNPYLVDSYAFGITLITCITSRKWIYKRPKRLIKEHFLSQVNKRMPELQQVHIEAICKLTAYSVYSRSFITNSLIQAFN